MSWGLTALILIRLDVREGEWVTVAELEAYTHGDAQTVRTELLRLHVEGLLEARCAPDGTLEAARTPATVLRAAVEQAA